jgi:hypothetical protein
MVHDHQTMLSHVVDQIVGRSMSRPAHDNVGL